MVLLAFVVLFVYRHRSQAVGTRQRGDLKQPKGALHILGHLPLLAFIPESDMYQFIPENVEHVIKTNFWGSAKGLMCRDIIKFRRMLISHIFSVKTFREYTSDVFVMIQGKKVAVHLNKAAEEGIVVDFQVLVSSFTLDSIGVISFRKSFGSLDDIEHKIPFAASFDDLLKICGRRLADTMWRIRESLTSVGMTTKYHRKM
ncbi:hypothetical protein BGZ65_007979, partial [Modicella reniformis]